MLLAVAVLVMTFIYRRHLKLCGVLIKYATRFLADSFCVYFYLPLFLLATLVLLLLFLWQYVAFSTANPPYRVADDIYWRASGNTFLQVLNVLELIWGLQFLRDSCNRLLTKSISSYRETQSNGTSHIARLTVRLHSSGCLNVTSAASSEAHCSTAS